MFQFLLGAIVGAAGYWAYQNLMGNPSNQAPSWSSPTSMGMNTGTSGVVEPSASGVVGRPSQPIPGPRETE